MQDGKIRDSFDVDGFSAYMEIVDNEIQITNLPKAFAHFTKMIAYLLTGSNGFAMDKENIRTNKQTAKEVFDVLKDPLAKATQQHSAHQDIQSEIEGLDNLIQFMFGKAPNPDFSVLSRSDVQSLATQVGIILGETKKDTIDNKTTSFHDQLKRLKK